MRNFEVKTDSIISLTPHLAEQSTSVS